MSNENELKAGLRERIRDAIAADELVLVPASDIKDQYCHVTELALDHIADIAAQAAGGVDGVAAVKEAWAALQVAVLDGRGWADKIVPMQKAIDALTPAQGGDTQRLDGDFGLASEYAANLRNAGHILVGVHRKNGGEYPLEQCPRCQAVRYVDYACSTCGRVDLNNKFIELRKRISATIHGLQNLDIMEAPEPAMLKGGRDDG